MAHRRANSRSSVPITFTSQSPSPMSSTFTLPIMSSPLLAVGHPRKPKMHRSTFLALFALIAVSTYIFFVARPTLAFAPITLRADSSNGGGGGGGGGGAGRQISANIDADKLPRSRLLPPSRHRKTQAAVASARPQVQLDQAQELAAVSSFLASLPQNIIPSSVDPSQPIDPQLVLDFDIRSPRAADEVKQIVDDVWTRNPVILFAELRSSRSREVRAIIDGLNLSPPPTIFDIDERDDANVLTPLLHRLTSSTELPILVIGGKPVGTISQIKSLQRSRNLHKMVTNAGAVIDGTLRRRKGRK